MRRKKKLTSKYISLFCAEMAAVYRAGMLLTDGLQMLMCDADKDGNIVLQSLYSKLVKGYPLSVALRESGYFPNNMSAMTEVGETTGRQTETMTALSEYYDMRERQATALKNAVFYPVVLFAMMAAVVVILIVRVLPIFNDSFERLGARMSPAAEAFMRFGAWLGNASAVIAIIVGVLLLLLLIFRISPKLRDFLGNVVKKRWGNIGIFGDIAALNFVSAMALSMASGVQIEVAVNLASVASGGSDKVAKQHDECKKKLRSGLSLAEAMGESGIISQREMRMLELGTRAGGADTAMAEIARRKERNLQERISRAINRIEPALIATISLIVGVILLTVMLPLMGIMSSLG